MCRSPPPVTSVLPCALQHTASPSSLNTQCAAVNWLSPKPLHFGRVQALITANYPLFNINEMQIHMSKQSPRVQDAELRYLLLPALGGKDGYCPQTTGARLVGPHCLGAMQQGIEGVEVFSPQQILAAGWGYARLGEPGALSSTASTLLHTQNSPPHPLRLAPTAPSVPVLLPSSGFAFSKSSPVYYSFCHAVALPSQRANPAPF